MAMQNNCSHIFIGGAPRSGTTLVQRILGAHSMVYAGPEFDLVPEIIKLREQFLLKIKAGRISAYLNEDEVNFLFGEFISSLFENKLRQTGKKYISEKTPSNIGVFAELLECMPEARFVFVVRDPRSIVASMLEVGRKYRDDSKVPPTYTRNALSAVEYINSLWEKGGAAILKSNKVWVAYYEDLVGNPEKAIREMTDFLGLPFEKGLLNIQESDWEMPAFKSGEEYWYTKEQLRDGIRQDATEKWAGRLSGYELYVIDKRLKRIPGITDRYRIEVETNLQCAFKALVLKLWAGIKRFWVRAFSKLSRLPE